MTDDVRIAAEAPDQPGVLALITALDAYLNSLYPAESNYLLDAAALAAPEIRFLVARRGGAVVGIGALRLERDYGEIKRMFVPVEARGQGVARRLMESLEAEARRAGRRLLRLETGNRQPEALALYRRAGFVERGPFGDYPDDPVSVFMEKTL